MAAPVPDDTITIASGLPRSGTSMMMRMLEAGGMETVSDRIRAADIDNPNGYYEFERVKQIKTDAAWLPETRGKVFKMVSMLLFDLPAAHPYKIIFMQRDMPEILASQARMLARLGGDSGPADEAMGPMFEKHLVRVREWLTRQPNIDVLGVAYRDAIRSAEAVARGIAAFLGRDLDTAAMAAVVDPSLYRNRGPDSVRS